MLEQRIVLAGGAGLVGQNLVVRLTAKGYRNIVVIDKHSANLETLAGLHPEVESVLADLSVPGPWQDYLAEADVVVLLQAQIGGNDAVEFEHNNIDATRLILEAMEDAGNPYLVHVSSSVVESVADDFYSRTKRAQEDLVLDSGIKCPVLRPTLMYGWFDRKHLGWLSADETRAVAEDLGVTPAEVNEMERRLSTRDLSFDPSPQSDEDDNGFGPAAYLPSPEQDPADAVAEDEWLTNAQGQLREALADLDDRSRDILQSRWLTDDKATLQNLAERYGVSAERIRQLEANALKKLRGRMAAAA